MPIDQLKRREFVTLIGGVAAWPITARAQQPERVRRIGVLINFRPDDPEGQARLTAFRQTLRELGWIDGDNVRMDVRWTGDDAELYRRYAEELVALAPDVILAGSSTECGGAATGYSERADRLCVCCRPTWCRVCHHLGTARRQHHGICGF
jgi:hypothetical protein